jgi:hypothetical protein
MKVYQAINAVQKALSVHGITKDRQCTQGASFMFRGIDDVYNAISPLLAEHGLCILPRMVSRNCVERTSAKGNALFYVTVEAEFDFVSSEDGSKHTVRTFGEAMDSGDKATNKAMSAAYKYAAFQAFAIPTEGDNDADAVTHQVAPQSAPQPKNAPSNATIGDVEFAEINAMLDATNSDKAGFCAYFKIPSVSALPLAKYAQAVSMLKSKTGAPQ